MDLPSIFPIFPLDQVILVPGAMLPLHVFEPRYRQMVRDALNGERMLAMAMSAPGHRSEEEQNPPIHPVCGLGRIVHHQAYEDGRSDIILEGLARMRIEEELETNKLYRIVRAVPFHEIEPDEDLSGRVQQLLERARCFDAQEKQLYAALPLSRLLDSLLIRVPVPIAVKREIFATARLSERLEGMERAMDHLEAPPRTMRFDPGDPRLN